MEILSATLDVLESLALIIAAVIAAFGINAWRREHVGKKRAELAEETLALFYEAQDVINAARRSQFGYANEWEEAAKMGRDNNRGSPTRRMCCL